MYLFTCITEPLLQQWFELAHVLETEIESLKAGNCGLTEIISIELPHSQTHISLKVEPSD